MITDVLRGADPELFLVDKEGQPVTSIGLIGGTKSKPRDLGNGYALQEDNVAVEFNIPPTNNSRQFVASIQYALGVIKQDIKDKELDIAIVPTMEFYPMQLAHPQAQELGCEPDYNAWSREVNPRPKAPELLRSSGGHLHIGYANPNDEDSIALIKAHDLFCGVASVLYDSDTRRREIYGKAGAHRIKGYGVEYRTLSNFWIKTPELTNWLFEQSEKAVNFINSGQEIPLKWGNKIIECINTGNKSLVAQIDREYKVL
jgi:hypothetical protein